MAPKKGTVNNPNGRPTGSTNKVTGQLREAITNFIEGNFDEVVKDWRTLEAKDKLTFYRDLIQYVIPKMQSQDITSHNEMTAEEADKQIREFSNRIIDLYESGELEGRMRMRSERIHQPARNFNQ